MFIFKALIFSLITCVVKSQEVCTINFTDTNRKPIDLMQYCKNKVCITKCCDVGKILNSNGTCEDGNHYKDLFLQINFTNITLPSWEEAVPREDSRKFLFDFVFVHEQNTDNTDCYYEYGPEEIYYILENGMLMTPNANSLDPWVYLKNDKYCLEYRYIETEVDNTTIRELKLIFKEVYDMPESEGRITFMVSAMTISCFFLLLVLVVYSLLPYLRTIAGLLLMAFVSTLFATCSFRVVLLLIPEYLSDPFNCQVIFPFLYFLMLSNCFWLNIMAFDAWWTLRGIRKSRDIHRRGEMVKFIQYCVYAWGNGLLMTICAVLLDNIDLSAYPNSVKPPFRDGMYDRDGIFYYLTIPIAIVSSVNIVFFIMTVYNIHLVKKGVHSSADSSRSKKEGSRFALYLKLSVVMGVNWYLELIPTPESDFLFYLCNLYNSCLGVIIFYLYVFNKKVLNQLCRKFNIKYQFDEKMQASRSGTTRQTKLSTSKRNTSQSQTEESPI